MTSNNYEPPHMPLGYPRFERRRPSGHIPPPYDRHANAPPRRRSPSPPPPRRPYDAYAPPHRPDTTFRDDAPNGYRSTNAYRPNEYTNGTYYSRSPSPDPYTPAPRISEPEPWDQQNTWRPPPPLPPPAPIEIPNMWPERKPAPPSPAMSARGRDMRDDGPSRAFEPSESWKQIHVDRPGRPDHSPADRYFGRRGRKSMGSDMSPDRAYRNDRSGFSGDRYRPVVPMKRESFPAGRSDSYRPNYDGGRNPAQREPVSPIARHMRRDSGSLPLPRSASRLDSPYTNRSFSRKGSPSNHSVISLINTPGRPVPEIDSWNSLKPDVATRPPSRSSIASTHVSMRSPSPRRSSEPNAVGSSTTVVPPSIPAPQETPRSTENAVATVSDSRKVVDTPPPAANSFIEAPADPTPVIISSETSTPPGLVSKENKIMDSSPSPPKPSTPSNTPSLRTVSPPNNAEVNVTEQIAAKSLAEVPVPSATTTDIVMVSPTASPSLTRPPTREVTSAPLSPVLKTVPPTPPPNEEIIPLAPALEIQQPKPIYGSPTTPNDIDMAIDIPPTTHSPPNEDSPPDSPAVVTPKSTFPAPYPTIEEIPSITEAKTREEAFRIVVMSRLLSDRITREERVNPVLMANLSISTPLEVHPTATPDSLLERMFNKNEQEMKDRMASFIKTRPMLCMYLEKRTSMIEQKATRLRAEYLALQEKWIAHCTALNDHQKSLASEHELHHSGRTTRRTTAFTDAVRSDFEMEQIIASLGNDDATDPNHLSMRNLAKIPDMISVTKGQVDYLFDDTSNRVENPKDYYAPHTGIQDWKEDEKKIFIEKFAAHPKQFGIIADFLPNKTAAQCVDFYYLHKHNFIDFRKVISQLAPNKRRRRGMGKKKGNGLLVDIAIHDMEVNRGGVANDTSVSAPVKGRRGRKPNPATLEARAAAARRAALQDTPTATPTPEPESAPPTRGRRRKAAAAQSALAQSTTAPQSASATPSRAPTPGMPPPSAPPSTAPSAPPSAPSSAPPSTAPTPAPAPVVMSAPSMPPPSRKAVPPPPPPVARPTTESAELDVDPRPPKRAKRTRKIKSAAIVSDDPPSPTAETDKALPFLGGTGAGLAVDGGGELSARGKGAKAIPSVSQWSEDDKRLFISLLSQHGDNFKRIAAAMPNKTTIQVSHYYASNKDEMGFAAIVARAPKRSPTPPEHPENWNELPYAHGSRAATPPMASLSYDGQPNGKSYEHTRHLSSEGVSLSATMRTRASFTSNQTVSSATVSPPPPMARLDANGNNGRRSSMTASTTTYPGSNARTAYPFPPLTMPENVPHDTMEAYRAGPQTQPYFAPIYVPPPPPPHPSTYAPVTLTLPTSANSIVHSPQGGSASLPMNALHHPYVHPVHGHPHMMHAPGESPHHQAYYSGAAAAAAAQAQAQAHASASARMDARAQWGPYPYYRESPPIPVGAPVSSGSAGRREGAYPMFGSSAAGASVKGAGSGGAKAGDTLPASSSANGSAQTQGKTVPYGTPWKA